MSGLWIRDVKLPLTMNRAAWEPELLEQGGHCKPSYVLTNAYYACTAVNIVTDWITAAMFVPFFYLIAKSPLT